MKLKVGNFYKLLATSGLDRGGQWECVKIERNKAHLKQESLLVVNIPCSLVFIRPTSQVFINYKHKLKETKMIKTNIKMRVNSEQSKQVQEICFANGISWNNRIYEVQHIHSKYLFINKAYLTYCDTDEFFKDKGNEEVDASLFIRTQGTCFEELLSESYVDNLEYLSDFWNKEETMEKNEVESYADVKEYLIAKGLYERVLEIDWETYEEDTFSDLFTWSKTEEGYNFWEELYDEMIDLDISDKVESLVQDYKAKQGKEFIKHLETKPEEVVEAKPLEKPKQYLCYVQGKALPKHIHKTLEQAKQEAKRLCRKELAKVSVLEVVAEFEAEVIIKEV